MSGGRIPERADVVVIGGGPAGSTAANLLAQRGYEVVLFDKVKHPRLTVGESLLPHFWKYADALGATENIERARFIRKSGGTGMWHGTIRQMKMVDFGHERPSLHIERAEFDHILLETARRKGVQAFEEVVVRKVHLARDEQRVAYGVLPSGVEGQVRCRYVIDASGQAAVLANQLGIREFDRDLRFMSVWGYFENSDYIAQGGVVCPWDKRREIRPTTVQAGIGEWGWCWHIPQKDSTSVGLVLAPAQQAEFKASGATLEERFVKACRAIPRVGDLLREATLIPDSLYAIRDFAYRPTQLAGDGWFLAGDAAAFVDPINSAGVVTAFYGGFLAAQCVDGCLRSAVREQYYRQLFSTLLLQRLSLFRVSALPEGHNSYPQDYPIALRAARLDSALEQDLLSVQTRITGRPGNLGPLLEMDPRLNYFRSNHYRELEELVLLSAEAPVV